jgi:23S rRNA pseudouridine2605 synthase
MTPGNGGLEVEERLQKALARAGVASRRHSEELILAGRVAVNGEIITTLGTRVDPDQDSVSVDGQVIAMEPAKRYYMLHKPNGTITSVTDPYDRRTVLDLLDVDLDGLFPVGRLDQDTEGLLLITNDGELAFRLTHPRFTIPKTYLAHVRGTPDEDDLARLRRGVRLEDGITGPAEVSVVDAPRDMATIRLTIAEGRKREVRRMLNKVGHPVIRLQRLELGPLKLGALPVGQYRPLTEDEVTGLRQCVGLGGEAAGPAAGQASPPASV